MPPHDEVPQIKELLALPGADYIESLTRDFKQFIRRATDTSAGYLPAIQINQTDSSAHCTTFELTSNGGTITFDSKQNQITRQQHAKTADWDFDIADEMQQVPARSSATRRRRHLQDGQKDVNELVAAWLSVDSPARERKLLLEQVPAVTGDKDVLKDFEQQIAKFEKAAVERGLSGAEQGRFYEQMTRLLSQRKDTTVPLAGRINIALESLHLATTPTEVHQANYNTCNVATVEVRSYWMHPSRAAQVVADVALDAKTNVDGRKAVLRKEDVATKLNGDRAHASQIFQTAAVNLHWQNEVQRPGSKGKISGLVNKGDIHYELHKPSAKDDTGERLVDYSKSPPEICTTSKGKPFSRPRLQSADIAAVSELITGETGQRFYLRNADQRDGRKHEAIMPIESEEHLRKILESAKEGRDGLRLPLILKIHVSREPFCLDGKHAQLNAGRSSDSAPGGGGGADNRDADKGRPGSDREHDKPPKIEDPTLDDGDQEGDGDDDVDSGWHVVTITDYNIRDKKVAVDNTWDDSDDHLSPDRQIPLKVLYAATSRK